MWAHCVVRDVVDVVWALLITYPGHILAVINGACSVQSSSMPCTDDLLLMINEHGVNFLNLFAYHGAMHIEEAKRRPEVLRTLQSLRAFMFTGVPMDPQTLKWGYDHGIPLQVSCVL
jgi:acyl-coenzyme A synthetase/AMP-(fatty) acid ligase